MSEQQCDKHDALVKLVEEWDEQPSGEGLLAGKLAVLDFLHMPEVVAALSSPSSTGTPVDPDSEDANPVWDLVIEACKQAWPDGHAISYNNSPTELITDIINERDEALEKARSATVATPWTECEFSIISWEIDQGQIGISVKHAKGGSAWMVEPVDHVKNLLRDGLRYRWLRGGTTDYTPMFQQALCLEAMDDWIDSQMVPSDGGNLSSSGDK